MPGKRFFLLELSVGCLPISQSIMVILSLPPFSSARSSSVREAFSSERALDTMSLLCKEIDPDGEKELRKIYREVRGRAEGGRRSTQVPFAGLEQPESESKRGSLIIDSLLEKVGTSKRFNAVRQINKQDPLNDQNDRIATWISRYETENGRDSLSGLNREIFNRIIETFICDSNPEAIQRTKRNIAMIGQREPGVTLADGRIVDGNRRFTCLRMLQRETGEPQYFETVIMDMDMREDKKQIKLLELAIQHGEEKKVDYDLVDYAIGTYRDIVLTKLLTVEEYAQSTNEPLAEVRKRVQIAQVISEFLFYLGLPKQYYIAREYRLYELFNEMMPGLRQISDEEKDALKTLVFQNIMMGAIQDQRKFIRDVRSLLKSDSYKIFFDEQRKLGEVIRQAYASAEIRDKTDVDRFAREHNDITQELRTSLERALLRSRAQQLRARPEENVSKCISLMSEIDPRLFGKLDEEERKNLVTELQSLMNLADEFIRML